MVKPETQKIIKIVETSNIDTVATGITVYPSTLLVRTLTVLLTQNMETIFHLSDQLVVQTSIQRATVGAKIAFAAKMLQQNALVRLNQPLQVYSRFNNVNVYVLLHSYYLE